jgi:Ca2+-binding EF-hand superfamily protein
MFAGSVAAALAVAGVVSSAHADRGRGHHGAMMHGMMDRYDANKDGKLTQEEIDQNRTQWHAQYDADKSGGLTLAEFEALWLKARRDQLVREYQQFDRDGDGNVTLDEYKMPLATMVAERDINGDGMLSQDDRRRRRDRQHEQPSAQ